MLSASVNLVPDTSTDPLDAKKMFERWGPCAQIVEYVATDTVDTENHR